MGSRKLIHRLVLGYSPRLPELLKAEMSLDDQRLQSVMQAIAPQLQAQVINDAMPVQDAIDLAEFLVDVTIYAGRSDGWRTN
jgi:hypothetical protein